MFNNFFEDLLFAGISGLIAGKVVSHFSERAIEKAVHEEWKDAELRKLREDFEQYKNWKRG